MYWRVKLLGGLFVLLVLSVSFKLHVNDDTRVLEADVPVQNVNNNLQEKSKFDGQRAYTKRNESPNSAQSIADLADTGLDVFILNYSTKDIFDRFIFERTSEQPEVVKLAYATHAKTIYAGDSHVMAADLFSRYVDYKVALSTGELEVELSTHSLRDITYKLDEREQIRRKYFTDNEYHYLFSREAQVDEAALERLNIAQESALSREERKSLIMESIKAAGRTEREAFQPTLNMQRINEIKQTHNNINDRFNAVAAEFGPEVAERFSKTWEQQAQWQENVEKYKRFRDELTQQGLSHAAIEQALLAYQEQHFTANEVKRLHVLTGR